LWEDYSSIDKPRAYFRYPTQRATGEQIPRHNEMCSKLVKEFKKSSIAKL